MKKQSARGSGEPHKIPDICAALERLSGLPCPPHDAPDQRELWAQYEVTSNFLLAARYSNDPVKARCQAAEYTLRNAVYPLEMLRPHIERGLGRKLLDDEIVVGELLS
ncbi:hypothetical protein [Mesorhizobium sp. M0187]|uniref:hypothetical protein n=1 Tax=Mesorhizobium sp. M0187 TaxID=2956908 RepID=UPI0033354650